MAVDTTLCYGFALRWLSSARDSGERWSPVRRSRAKKRTHVSGTRAARSSHKVGGDCWRSWREMVQRSSLIHQALGQGARSRVTRGFEKTCRTSLAFEVVWPPGVSICGRGTQRLPIRLGWSLPRENPELLLAQVFVVLRQEWPENKCRRFGALLSLVTLWCCLALSLMQVRVTSENGGHVARTTGNHATEKQCNEKNITWSLLSPRAPALAAPAPPSPVKCAMPVTRLHRPAVHARKDMKRRTASSAPPSTARPCLSCRCEATPTAKTVDRDRSWWRLLRDACASNVRPRRSCCSGAAPLALDPLRRSCAVPSEPTEPTGVVSLPSHVLSSNDSS